MLRRAGHGHHALLVARFIEGKRVPAIADELGVTPKAARLRIYRAVAALQRRWGQ
jgi:DNA-directed RNA polymerase specialized sigma24 family protein